MSEERALQRAIDGLHAVRVARDTYASSEKAVEIVRTIADALDNTSTPQPAVVSIDREVGKALRRVYLGEG
ncbi:ethanolamine utilization protein EutA (predicted chaperonin) [Pseudochelatococcus lubricantis]|uniref:Ethanolamine utilization protein EutA (Predicted chaperonin) n=1 Tax=Pseudochelatococcus lubricantis TaxID=1538102 RepID=A0ABX0UWC7_9HYPH|nr:hypothetical protein [Pseudochelatococcus lubricantis]NIJ57248.1 ethanolamine utilization protein EutA (predicted chaperonin) [Pseudochelatococcus lubricantis]